MSVDDDDVVVDDDDSDVRRLIVDDPFGDNLEPNKLELPNTSCQTVENISQRKREIMN